MRQLFAPPLSTDTILIALMPRAQGLRIAECVFLFPEPRPSYVAVQNAMRKLERQDIVKRVGWGRYALTGRYRSLLGPRGVVIPLTRGQ
jgi:hypothetical protein